MKKQVDTLEEQNTCRLGYRHNKNSYGSWEAYGDGKLEILGHQIVQSKGA